MASEVSISERRVLAMAALSNNVDASRESSAASQLGRLVDESTSRPMVVSGDVDGLVTATMLGTVAPWKIVAVILGSKKILVHPDYPDRPGDIFGVDVFSLNFDNISNHIVLFGSKKKQNMPATLEAFREWDSRVMAENSSRTFLVPSIWAGTEASYSDRDRATSSKFKYPLGCAQLLLALLDGLGMAPKFYDRRFLPWLVADCDGGVLSLQTYRENVEMWWGLMAGAIGPGSMTWEIHNLVTDMRGDSFDTVKDRLKIECRSKGIEPFLNDAWNLAKADAETLIRFAQWLQEISLWADPFDGGVENLRDWNIVEVTPESEGKVYLASKGDDAANAAIIETAAAEALNANFRMGGEGDRFNWHGGW